MLFTQNSIIRRQHFTALPREYSDHCPLVLQTTSIDFGPSPFRFFNSWLSYPGLSELILDTVSSFHFIGPPDKSLATKLRKIKEVVKTWRMQVKENEAEDIMRLKQWICDLDIIVESRPLSSAELENRIEWKRKILELEHRQSMDLKQKARIRAIDGDEKSHFFHGIINHNLSNNRINGLSINGVWSTDPEAIKNEIFSFFKDKFFETMSSRPSLSCNFNKTLSRPDASFLVEPFSATLHS